jgi:hypothetical protein
MFVSCFLLDNIVCNDQKEKWQIIDKRLYLRIDHEWTLEVIRGHRGHERMVVGFATPVQSVAITTNVVSLNPAHGEVYSIQHYVRKFVNDLRQVGGFLHVLRFPPSLKLTAMITEILLKVALYTITLTLEVLLFIMVVFMLSKISKWQKKTSK